MSGTPTSPSYPNRIREGLETGDFTITVEIVAPARSEPLAPALEPACRLAEDIRDDSRIAGLSVTDRVHSDDDHDPVAVAALLAAASGAQPLIHLAGKDRELADLIDAVDRMCEAGLTNALILTGDRVHEEPGDRQVRYLESVPAIVAAKQAWPAITVAAAVAPFKYREEELVNQYLKLGKKRNAGADYIITEIGYDMAKFQELVWWCAWRGYDVPLVANLMPLNAPRGRHFRRIRLPGVVVTDDFQALLEEDEKGSDKGEERVWRRLALQMFAVKRMGYAGVQLTAVHTWEELTNLLNLFDALDAELTDGAAWRDAWQDTLRFTDRRNAQVSPADGYDLFTEVRKALPGPVSQSVPEPLSLVSDQAPPELAKYRWLDRIDHWFFAEGSPGARLYGPVLARLERGSVGERLLLGLEKLVKQPTVGCETCGACRLGDTFYVCPETCPKGLANGPCGGTENNVCEFGDRECIHNTKYRIAKHVGRLWDLEQELISVVPREQRGACSWPPHFRGDGPQARRADRRKSVTTGNAL